MTRAHAHDARSAAQALRHDLDGLLLLPRPQQQTALVELRAKHSPPETGESWNTAFGPGSLFDAWTRSSVAQAIYEANARTLAAQLADRVDWCVIEVGGGDGRLWTTMRELGLLDDLTPGTLVVIDPVPEVGERVVDAVPAWITVEHRLGVVQSATQHAMPECDAVVCSLTLHHLAGRDQAARRRVGLDGPGKAEVLAALGRALSAREGLLLLNEADIHCDIELAPHDPVLAERLLDSYVRRCARSLLADIATREDADEDLRWRWLAVVHHWCLAQVELASVSVAARDVYELDVGRWLDLFDQSALRLESHCFTDSWGLFHRYLLRPD